MQSSRLPHQDKAAKAERASSTDELGADTLQPLDYSKLIEVSRQLLPHWLQDGVTYFVTFRLADSIPTPLLKNWLQQRTIWLEQHGIIRDSNGQWKRELEARHEAERREFSTRFTAAFERMLDSQHGSCLLRESDCREILENTFRLFHGERYALGRFVIMPNHAHVLVQPFAPHALRDILYSWKSFSARKINEALSRRGRVWQSESYDHIVRDEHDLKRIENYVLQNPAKANLRGGFTLG